MVGRANNVITINAGSSSIKLGVFTENDSGIPCLSTVSISGIGQPTSTLQVAQSTVSSWSKEVHVSDYVAAFHMMMESAALPDDITAIGHRLVHGGSKFTQSVSILDISDDDWKFLSKLDPHHTPVARKLVNEMKQYYPSTAQIACFDTTFFRDLPRVAKILPIPQKYYEKGVRRYGFHGLSYMSLLSTFEEKAGHVAANGRVILAHLGSGASLTATHFGKPVDTTMGFTPASGVVMSTRSGDIDPSVSDFLHDQESMSSEMFDYMVNFKSGLLGVSGVTGEMHVLLEQEKANEDAALAVELFVRDVKKTIGAFCAELGGVDSLIFSGGIGEQSSVIRSRICQGLEYAGIVIDDDANEKNSFLISAPHSMAGVHVISTDEAHVIATEVIELLNTSGRS